MSSGRGMRRLDRLAQKQHREAQAQAQAQATADRADDSEVEQHQLVSEIRVLIPSVLKRLEQIDPGRSGMQSLTYEVQRVPLFEDRFGWRQVTRAAWEIGAWTIPTSASSRSTPVWLLSNGLIGYNGLDGEPIVDSIEKIAPPWPSMLPVILAGLRETAAQQPTACRPPC